MFLRSQFRLRAIPAGLSLWALAMLAACPKPGPTTAEPKPPPNDPTLPSVPVAVDAELKAADSAHEDGARSPLLAIMTKENQRWASKVFPKSPAYYIAYTIHDRRSIVLEAESGSITADSDEEQRALGVEVRAGSAARDSRHPLRDPRLDGLTSYRKLSTIPLGSDEKAIAHHLWLETDRRLRESEQVLSLVETQERIGSDKKLPPDFSHEEKIEFIQPVVDLQWTRDEWESRVRECSSKARSGVATRGSCRLDAEVNTVYYVNSEGSTVQKSWTTARLSVSAGVKADDGMPLSRLEQEFANTPDELPDDARMDEMAKAVATDLEALHKAPVVNPWAGPAILEGRAAAVFFHEVFGHRIEGHRQKNPEFGKTFTNAVGKQIMPSWLSVYDNPLIREINGTYLNGFYYVDDEGVPAQRVSLVDQGVLKGFVMARSPIDGFSKSNGHGRSEPGLEPVARQGNLVVEASKSVDKKELYKRLLDEVKAQGKEFGMVFTDISGGFTNTSTFSAQSFKVQPIMAYRLYPDGRKELVRGVDISGLPLTVLDNLLAAARPLETFNGMCGAESGWVPVSASAPSLLVKTLEVEKGFEPNNADPVLPPPSVKRQGDK